MEKTGCGEEDLRFETAEALLPMLGVLSVVAVRMLQLRWWGRQHGAAAATAAATTEELEVIRRLGHRVQTARDFVHAVAKLGGFLGQRWGTGVEDPVAGLPATPGHADGHEAGWEDARSRYRYKST